MSVNEALQTRRPLLAVFGTGRDEPRLRMGKSGPRVRARVCVCWRGLMGPLHPLCGGRLGASGARVARVEEGTPGLLRSPLAPPLPPLLCFLLCPLFTPSFRSPSSSSPLPSVLRLTCLRAPPPPPSTPPASDPPPTRDRPPPLVSGPPLRRSGQGGGDATSFQTSAVSGPRATSSRPVAAT